MYDYKERVKILTIGKTVLGGIRERGYFDSLLKTGFVSIRYDVLDHLPSVVVAYRTDSGVELKLSGSSLRKARILKSTYEATRLNSL